MVQFDVPEPEYDRYTNRQLAAVPLAVLAVALLIIIGFYVVTGAPTALSIDFTGGTELTVVTTDDRQEIQQAFDRETANIRSVQGEDNQYILTFGPADSEGETQSLQDQARENLAADGDREIVQSIRQRDPTFAEETQTLALGALVVAFAGMGTLAFVFFRTFVPSVAIIVSAFSDVVIPIAMMDVLGIELSLGTVAALLMLIGYSVDSDILLNNQILRRGGGGFYESTYRAMETGVTMTITSMSAMAVMAIVATFYGIDLLADIGLILFIGLAADLMNTYLLNLSLLRWYKLGEVNP
jgi:preprotein translocase subunit SecF